MSEVLEAQPPSSQQTQDEVNLGSRRSAIRGPLALRCCVWQTSSMKPSPNHSQCHEDRKTQKLLDRIHKKLQEKDTKQNSLQAASPKQCPNAA